MPSNSTHSLVQHFRVSGMWGMAELGLVARGLSQGCAQGAASAGVILRLDWG